MEYSETERKSLAIAGSIIVVSAIAIAAFFYTGGGIIFYAVAILALLLEVYMAYRISQESEEKKPAQTGRSRKSKK